MPDQVTGYINHFRILLDAIIAGRVEARELKDMTDEQLEQKIKHLRAEAREAIDEGYRLHEPGEPTPKPGG